MTWVQDGDQSRTLASPGRGWIGRQYSCTVCKERKFAIRPKLAASCAAEMGCAECKCQTIHAPVGARMLAAIRKHGRNELP